MKLTRIPWFETAFCLGFGIVFSWLTYRSGSWMFGALAVLTLSSGILYLIRSGWGHLLTAAALAVCVFGIALPGAVADGMTLRRGLILAGCGWGFWHHIAMWKQLRQNATASPPMNSMVLLLAEPVAMNPDYFKSILKRAWDIDADVSTEGAEPADADDSGKDVHIIIGEPPHMLLFSNFKLWAMHTLSVPYWEDPEAVAESCRELRMAHAILNHKAWLSFDCIGDDEMSRLNIYERIGKVIAECVDEHTLGVVIPEEGHFIPISEDLVDQLRSPMPLQGLQNAPYAPVINVEDTDEALKVAVAQARDRWPEFKKAFSEREEGQSFSVKTPITAGGSTEFIWVNVDQLNDGVITGTLGNEPVDLGDLTLGSSVSFPEEDVNDWAYSKGDELVGLFSANVFSPDIEE